MLKRWLLALGLGATVLAGALPAYAQGPNGAVTDDGRNVYSVNGLRGELYNSLPAEQVRQIVALQWGRGVILPASPVSPDDQMLPYVLMCIVRVSGFGVVRSSLCSVAPTAHVRVSPPP